MPTKSKPKTAVRALEIVRRLKQTYPDATCALNWRTPLQLLIATILSAQSTDVGVNKVTKTLFEKYKKPEDYLKVSDEELQNDIRSTGFFRNKARSLKGSCMRLLTAFGGKVPKTMDAMLTLPGVARKTANVVLGTAYGIPTGITVDTHVTRVAYRLGLTKEKDPPKIEQDLMKLIPQEDWIFAGHAIIWHGRQICEARKPKCDECPLNDMCEKRGVK